jgi:sortase (surface protein transpeptidase)
VSQQPPPPSGREGPWPSRRPQGRPQGRGPQGPAGPQRPGGPQPPPGATGQPRQQPGQQPGQHRQSGPTPRPRQDRPTTFIPKVDETSYLPRVEDFGAVSQGRSPDRFPDRDPDDYQPRHGSFGPPPLPPRTFDDDLTEVLPAVPATAGPPDRPAATDGRGRSVLRTTGEALITLGMVVLLFVVYELYITNIFAAQKQASATTSLDQEWDTVFNGANGVGTQRTTHYDLTDGHGIAKLYIPAFGQDYVFTVVEGTTQDDLAIGPGHYVGSGLPGQPGNFAVAGHRVGEGAPFDDLGLVQSCDAILIETQTDWYVYRMLPLPGEAAGWAAGKGASRQCSGPNGEAPVKPLGGLYAQTVGREIVLPSEGDVVAPIPHHYGTTISAGQEASLLTLTTCNPKFSAAQRMILHAVLVKDWKKTPGAATMPPEMKETS